jgi:hypothetical protein
MGTGKERKGRAGGRGTGEGEEGRTFSHIIWRLKYDIILSWKGVDPSHARVLEMATTYM